jgi:hypothetical protein
MTAVGKIVEFPDQQQTRRKQKTAFLPATLEIMETPRPSRWAR